MKLSLLVLLLATPAAALELKADLGHETARCHASPGKKHVWIFKQWHLAPSVDTTRDLGAKTAQAPNQTAIYQQLDLWASGGAFKTVLAEGCSGKIDSGFQAAFNGWSLSRLKAHVKDPDYASIVTHVPLKLKAKYDDRIDVRCADDDTLIKEQNLAFSDARGTLGFTERLLQHKDDPERAKPYLDGVIETFKLPKDTTVIAAITFLKGELKRTIQRIQDDIRLRDRRVLAAIQETPAPELALVIGGAHATDLVAQLEGAGIGCTVVEPVGYANDPEKLVATLAELAKAL